MESHANASSPTAVSRQRAAVWAALRDQVAALWSVERIPTLITAFFFATLFWRPAIDLAKDWWSVPEAGHGLLLAPVALWLVWRSGVSPDARSNHAFGLAVILGAVAIRVAAGLAAELFSMRASMVMALGGLTIYHYGFRQLIRWWLPFALACLAIPLPEIVTQALALPLQFQASRMGAAMLHMRDVPVQLSGNIIRLPGRDLFVTEACSGLRSLTALLSVAVLMSALVLRTLPGRLTLVLLAIPIAIIVNGVRVFLTGFFVFFVSPAFGEGFMHITEGLLLFLVSLASLGLFAWGGTFVEGAVSRFRQRRAATNA